MATEILYACQKCGHTLKKAFCIFHILFLSCSKCGSVWKVDLLIKEADENDNSESSSQTSGGREEHCD